MHFCCNNTRDNFNKGEGVNQWRKYSHFNKLCWHNWVSIYKKKKKEIGKGKKREIKEEKGTGRKKEKKEGRGNYFNVFLVTDTRYDSTWVIDQSVKCKTKTLPTKQEKNLCNFGLAKNFIAIILKTQPTGKNIYK